MRDDELKNLVDELLYLVEVGSGSTAADESELAHLLDRMALAVRHAVLPEEPEPLPAIPPRNFEVLQKVAASRFPNYGAYNRVHVLTREIGRARIEIASASEDVAIIADDLHAVSWLWRSASWDTGLWYLLDSYRNSWGKAMRHLQLYLHARSAERSGDEAGP